MQKLKRIESSNVRVAQTKLHEKEIVMHSKMQLMVDKEVEKWGTSARQERKQSPE